MFDNLNMSYAESEKLIRDSMHTAWKSYETKVLDKMPGMVPEFKPIFELIYKTAFQQGVVFTSAFMITSALQSQIETFTTTPISPEKFVKSLLDSMKSNSKNDPSLN
jgi:hypothetical protein